MAVALNLFAATVPSSVGSNNVLFGPQWNGNSDFTYDGVGTVTVGSTASEDAIQLIKGAGSGQVQIIAAGSDTNIQMTLADQGLGSFVFKSNSKTALQIYNTDSNVVNNFVINGGDAGNPPIFQATGSDPNVDFLFVAKGAGGVKVQSNSAFALVASNPSMAVVNYIQVTGATSGNAATISATGADTNINIALTGKGTTGTVQFANSGSFTANGSVATALTSIGPTGSHTTVQEWLTITNASGTTRYIPCF